MKTALKISILLNLFLFITVVFLANEPAKTSTSSQPAAEEPAPTPTPAPRVETKSFRWSQLESTNYQTYVQNLRHIGCPEQTLRDIVVADVQQLYQKRAEQLQQAHPDLQSLTPAETQQLAHEKAAVIAYLLGIAVQTTTPAQTASTTEASMPLAWQNIDLSQLNLEPAQLEAITEARQNFLDLIGGTSQDTASPAYLERWQKAQSQVDEQLAGAIGRKAFLEYESQATSVKQ